MRVQMMKNHKNEAKIKRDEETVDRKTSSNINVQTELIVHPQTFSFHFHGIEFNALPWMHGNRVTVFWHKILIRLAGIYLTSIQMKTKSSATYKNKILIKTIISFQFVFLNVYPSVYRYAHCKLNKINIKFIFGRINRSVIANCCF